MLFGQRLGNPRNLAGPVAASLAVRQGQGLSPHDHSQAIRQQGILGLYVFASHHEAIFVLLGRERLR